MAPKTEPTDAPVQSVSQPPLTVLTIPASKSLTPNQIPITTSAALFIV